VDYVSVLSPENAQRLIGAIHLISLADVCPGTTACRVFHLCILFNVYYVYLLFRPDNWPPLIVPTNYARHYLSGPWERDRGNQKFSTNIGLVLHRGLLNPATAGLCNRTAAASSVLPDAGFLSCSPPPLACTATEPPPVDSGEHAEWAAPGTSGRVVRRSISRSSNLESTTMVALQPSSPVAKATRPAAPCRGTSPWCRLLEAEPVHDDLDHGDEVLVRRCVATTPLLARPAGGVEQLGLVVLRHAVQPHQVNDDEDTHLLRSMATRPCTAKSAETSSYSLTRSTMMLQLTSPGR
jgi:hypothetical protein